MTRKFRGFLLKLLVFIFIFSLALSHSTYAVQPDNQRTNIMGQAVASREQMIKYLQTKNTNRSSAYIKDFVTLLTEEAEYEGVRTDVAFALIMQETNFLKFTGSIKESSNNLGNLGTTSFKDLRTGMRAVVQHLKAYASKDKLKKTEVDSRFKYVQRASAPYVEWLGINENPNKKGWSPRKNYGYEILSKLNEVKAIALEKPNVPTTPKTPEAKPKLNKTVVLDAGHGGSDPGAIKNGYYEKEINIKLAERLAEKLRAVGINLLYTRQPSNDKYISLEDRAAYANNVKADMFISLHHDSDVSSSLKGISVHYSSFKPGVEMGDSYLVYRKAKYSVISTAVIKNKRGIEIKGFYIKYKGKKTFVSADVATAYDPTPSEAAKRSADLAAKLAKSISSMGLTNRGIKDHNLAVTKNTNMTSVLIEAGFISNKAEIKKVTAPEFQDKMAEKIAETVIQALR